MQRDSFIMYTSFYEPIKDLTDAQLGQLFRAVFVDRMGEDNESHLADASVRMAFRFMANQFAVDDKKYEKTYAQRIKAAEASVNARKRSLANVNLNENENENENVNVNENVKGDTRGKVATAPTRTRFVKPSLQEVAAYAASMHYTGFNADRFLAYYESNGWKVGRNPMKDWKAAVRNWHAKDKAEAAPKMQPTYDELHPIGDFSNEYTNV